MLIRDGCAGRLRFGATPCDPGDFPCAASESTEATRLLHTVTARSDAGVCAIRMSGRRPHGQPVTTVVPSVWLAGCRVAAGAPAGSAGGRRNPGRPLTGRA